MLGPLAQKNFRSLSLCLVYHPAQHFRSFNTLYLGRNLRKESTTVSIIILLLSFHFFSSHSFHFLLCPLLGCHLLGYPLLGYPLLGCQIKACSSRSPRGCGFTFTMPKMHPIDLDALKEQNSIADSSLGIRGWFFIALLALVIYKLVANLIIARVSTR